MNAMNIASRVSRPLVAAVVTTACAASVLTPVTAYAAGSAPVKATQKGTAAATPHVAAVPQPTAAGKLAPAGCTSAGGVAACDLYALAGSTSVLGLSVPIWGFSTTGAADSATAPGPVLVVNQGDTVTITLHNQLDGQQVSLALPGQSGVSWGAAPGDDTGGVASGETRTYTFTADRPGTFLYEAGHTANGTRQVAMGLAGALVVLATDGSAYGARDGYPSTTYDDDAVVVLSEIDPDLNNNPGTFDMRNFHPRYRLINGRPFPSTSPINTDQGHTVLLRYVNVGAETHAMSLLGADQVEVAQDGHPMKYATTLTAESIEPGESLDTLVSVPTGGEAKLPLYEAAQHLDNNGQNNGDPQQLAFGGMMTFLDTNAPEPNGDLVGPAASHLQIAPNPSDGTSDVTVTADFDDTDSGASNVDKAEYVIDDLSIGAGHGTEMTGAFGAISVTGATGTIPQATLAALDAGKHTVYVRALDSAGNWGTVGSVILNLPKTGPQTTGGAVDSPANGTVDVSLSATGDDSAARGKVDKAEYFIDTVGNSGSGIPMTLNRVAAIVSEDTTIAASDVLALGEGVHHLYVHSHDSLGLWGPTLDVPITVDLTGPSVDAGSVGPNPTNGVISDPSNPGNLLVSAQITDKDAGGAIQSTLTDAEAFLDPSETKPPADGTGFQLAPVDAAMDSTTEAVYGLIPISQVRALSDGAHHVYVHGKDAAGNWGTRFGIALTVDRTKPALGTATAATATGGVDGWVLTAPVADASLISRAEFWLGTGDPGAGRGTSVSVSTVDGNVIVTAPVSTIGTGTRQINLRAQDLAGNWSNAASVVVHLMKPATVFSDDFGSGNLSKWASSTGAVSVGTDAGIPADGTNTGLKVAIPGAGGTRIGYVTDTAPSTESEFHVNFAFDPHTLVPANAVTIFNAVTATNVKVFAIQYRLYGKARQLRVLLYGTAGVVTGPWVGITTGAHTIGADWISAGLGSVNLTVDGTTVDSRAANTSTRKVGTAMLGLVAGTTTKSTGTAFFDSYVSTRRVTP